MTRPYDMTRRSRLAQETADSILAAAEHLLGRALPGEVTLHAIAERADVSVQTVLRHFGSREGCLRAVYDRVGERIDRQRGSTPPGAVDAALADLLEHYEAEGRLVLNLLAHEAVDPAAQEAVEIGRAYHRRWIEHVFRPLVDIEDQTVVDALVAATDIYLWKLLRLDLERTPEEVRATLDRLVRAVLDTVPSETP